MFRKTVEVHYAAPTEPVREPRQAHHHDLLEKLHEAEESLAYTVSDHERGQELVREAENTLRRLRHVLAQDEARVAEAQRAIRRAVCS